jgi:hypothetical protein
VLGLFKNAIAPPYFDAWLESNLIFDRSWWMEFPVRNIAPPEKPAEFFTKLLFYEF